MSDPYIDDIYDLLKEGKGRAKGGKITLHAIAADFGKRQGEDVEAMSHDDYHSWFNSVVTSVENGLNKGYWRLEISEEDND